MHMAEPVNVADPYEVGPSYTPLSSYFSMEEHHANLSREMEEMSTLH